MQLSQTYLVLFSILQCLAMLSCSSSVQKQKYEDAYSIFDGKTLEIGTNNIKRTWKLADYGLVTKGIFDIKNSKQWVNLENSVCDWEYSGVIDRNSKAELLSYTAVEDNDSGFTSKHLRVELEFYYPEVETYLKYQIRAYPGATGLYSNISLKGNLSKYVKTPEVKNGVNFNLIKGKNKGDYQSQNYEKGYIANFVADEKGIEYLISGLDRDKKYKVGFTWWVRQDNNLIQNVKVTSVDGETQHAIYSNAKVPNSIDKQKSETKVFDLPSDVLLDGSFRLFIDKVKGNQAMVSELWIMEQSDNEYLVHGNIDRVAQLKGSVNPGYVLVSYNDCGTNVRQSSNDVTGRVDFLPVDATEMTRKYIGYYNDAQHRNTRETPMLREEIKTSRMEGKEMNSWASILLLGEGSDALMVVKESHKCVNQYGIDTGDFILTSDGIANTGTSLRPNEVLSDRYRKAWASWTIVGENTEDGVELALKSFERLRYPVNPETDIYIMANTWGSDRGVEASGEDNVLKEIEIQKYLGIDAQQIDDGYHKPAKDNKTGKINGWYPHPDRYPEGFKNVRAKAEECGVRLGLWFIGMSVSLQEMIDNYNSGNFSYYKHDFIGFNNYNDMEKMVGKVRAIELYTNHKCRVNWDVTENAARFGYFWAQEYGCLHFENRKPKYPQHCVYVPYLVLRDLWHISKYCNLNKFQGSVQNKERVDKSKSDAYKHSYAYTTVIPLMSTPLFLQETQFYSTEARDTVKHILTAYKKERLNIYESLVYPIGDEPDNSNWSGFQAHNIKSKVGYITLFREINNKEESHRIRLRFIADKKVKFTNILNGEGFDVKVDKDGFVQFEILQAGDFRFLKYELL